MFSLPQARGASAALAALTAAMVLYGASFVAMKAASAHMDSWLIVFFRMALALAAFTALRPGVLLAPGLTRHLPGLLLMALCEPCLYFLFEAKALTLTHSSQAGMITALLPVMVAFGAWAAFGERFGRAGLCGLGLGLAGALLLSLSAAPTGQAPDPALGNLLELLAMVCAAGYTLLVKKLVRHFTPMFLTAFQALVGAVFFSPALFACPWPASLAWQAVAGVLFLGLFVSAGAYLLYNYSLSHLPAGRVGAAINLIPALALVFGWLVLGETVEGWQWLGVGLILAGARLGSSSA